MLDLTPSERRGALVLLVLVLLGSAWDLTHLRPQPARDAPAVPSGGSASGTPAPAVPPPTAAAAAPAGPLDLNRADAGQLDALPGIGPVLAGRIVARRRELGRFASPEDLLSVRGIGPRLFERLRPLVGCDVAGRTAAPDSLQVAR
ncbi:MAG: helix-hairpin-helix domain-containing protein [Candidatus Eisenbacteria bacterium]